MAGEDEYDSTASPAPVPAYTAGLREKTGPLRIGYLKDALLHPGLWVADSSRFPSNIGVNPQHSICAMAWTTAERIAAG